MRFNIKKIVFWTILPIATISSVGINSCSKDRNVKISFNDTVSLTEDPSSVAAVTFKLNNYESNRYVEKFSLDIDGVYDTNNKKVDYYDYSYDQSISSYDNILYLRNTGIKGKLSRGKYTLK